MNLGVIMLVEIMERTLYQLREVAHALPDEVQWRPIETAPKDGTVIDLWDWKYMHRVTDACWRHHYWENGKPLGEKSWGAGDRDGPFVMEPTHWMPLPKRPEDTK